MKINYNIKIKIILFQFSLLLIIIETFKKKYIKKNILLSIFHLGDK